MPANECRLLRGVIRLPAVRPTLERAIGHARPNDRGKFRHVGDFLNARRRKVFAELRQVRRRHFSREDIGKQLE